MLESVSGVLFPRGKGLVTRCATQLKLTKSAPGSAWKGKISVSWKEEQPEGTGELFAPEEIGERIEMLTKVLTGSSDFSTDSIILVVSSPDVPDLTVVDLPGIVRTATEGQSESVIKDVDALIEYYLKQERTIVLAVIPANVDIATVDILERARKHDPEGIRTVGIITKPDLVDAGAEDEVVATVKNIRKPLKLGYVIVKSRNQKALMDNVSLEDAQKDELHYFESHPQYSAVDKSLIGVKNLTARLMQILCDRIREQLPDIKAQVKSKLAEATSELKSIGAAPPTGSAAKTEFHKHVNDYNNIVCSAIRGNYSQRMLAADPKLRARALCRTAFDDFTKSIGECPFGTDESVVALKDSMTESRGRELPGFLNPDVFEQQIRAHLVGWVDLSQQCLEQVKAVLLEVTSTIAFKLLPKNFMKLRIAIVGVVHQFVEETAKFALQSLDSTMNTEIDQPYAFNGEFMNALKERRLKRFVDGLVQLHAVGYGGYALNSCTEQLKKLFSSVTVDAEDMDAMLKEYWLLTKRRISDTVPKVIFDHLVDRIGNSLFQELQNQINPEAIEGLFEVSWKETDRRNTLNEKIERLTKAHALLHDCQVTSA